MTEFTNQHLGLTDEEVLQSRSRHGDNVLTPPKRPSLWKLYLEKFEDPVVRVLLVAACFSLLISVFENEYAETIGIILAESMKYLSAGIWWPAVFPGLSLVLIVFLIDKLGDNLRRVLDPYSAQE